ncbi:HMG-I and HMG-Y, DNA-binding regulatory protein, TetR [Liquorilactobacillus oeni DSM 19972]|uniref:HMG-I and HMG-Y, DNA-binding regulatory protein, TetR n=2 Tax=Liquorilactobacillus oeni TaxID=303241 RepID=A0A0R1MAH2_9LACO|nr:HMG-I and HMG-Y, DNA-binding regulatory protein, TetR [Liquorilactobacillus oeni DSM 19972]
MGRNKKFNQEQVLAEIGKLFVKYGFNATSLDDIVKCTGLLRGSLYSTFGSKQGMFVSALKLSLKGENNQVSWGLLIIAMLEVAPRNNMVRDIVQQWYKENKSANVAELIGLQLLKHGGIIEGGQ